MKITDVVVEDKIDMLAKTCTLTLIPESKTTSPVAEFKYPGDTVQLTGCPLRPNGALLSISSAYANIPEHVLFSGLIEFMDDMEDADKYIFHVQLSDMIQGQPHRTKMSTIFNQYTYGGTNSFSPKSISSHSILDTLCKKLGIVFGRCDLPVYTVWGTFEVTRQTIIEVAQQLIGAFNTFDHTHYTIRCDRNGLQIIKVDYTVGGEVSNIYEMVNILSKQRSFEMYMPESRIGNNDVLLSGGDRYGKPGVTVIDASTQEAELTLDPNKPVVKKYTVVDVFTSDSKTASGYGTFVPMENWSETETTVEYDIDTTFATGINYAGFDGHFPNFGDPDLPEFNNSFEYFNAAYAEGQILDIAIVNTRVIKSEERSYNSVVGLQSKRTTTSTYAKMQFKTHLWTDDGLTEAKEIPDNPNAPALSRDDTYPTVLVAQETTTYLYTPQEFPQSMSRVTYTYDVWGGVKSTTTRSYIWSRSWILRTVSTENSSEQGTTNAEIQWQAAEAQARAAAGDRAAERIKAIASKKGPITSSVNWTIDAPPGPTPLGRYQLLNGVSFPGLRPNPILEGMSIKDQIDMFPKVSPLKIQNVWDYNNSVMEKEVRLKTAFQLSHPGMGYDGLRLLWALVLQEQIIETKGAYWEVTQVTATLDTSPVAGESIIIAGTSGIVGSVTHHLGEDEALTTVTLRRLICND